MKIVVSIDSFKGSLSSFEAGNAVKDAVLRLSDDAEVIVLPLADGGEGTVDAFSGASDSKTEEITVHNPLMQPCRAKYCILTDKETAVIEMAAASGLTLIEKEQRNPLNTTTLGVGEMIKDAVNTGCRRFIVGIGGSAINDGGVGMLMALGFEFLDKDGNSVELGANGLKTLSHIKTDNVIPELKDCVFSVACDVKNPLLYENGCSSVFGPQKGATPEMVADMDNWLESYAKITKSINKNADENYPGAGAAGGLGFAFMSFLNAKLMPGVDIILAETGLEEHIKSADIVVTGEGRLDSQTVMGKAPIGVAKLAKKYNKRVIAFSGCVTSEAEICNQHGIDAFFPILREVTTLDEALDTKNAYRNLLATAYQVFRLII